MKKILLTLLTLSLCLGLFAPTFAAKDTYYTGTQIKCGYYVSDDGTIGMLVETGKIQVFDLYDADKKRFYKTEKEALKANLMTVSKEKPTAKKTTYDFKTLQVAITAKQTKLLLKTEGYAAEDAFKIHFAGKTYADAIKLAKKKLDTEFS